MTTADRPSPTELDPRRRRAAYRASHRGTKEMDFLMGRYAEARLPTMSDADLGRFEAFLALPDPELQAWILAPEKVADCEFGDLVDAVRLFHGLQARN